MLLNSNQIRRLVEESKIISNFNNDQLEASSYDLRVGSIFRDGEVVKNSGATVRVEPGEIVTCLTLEEVSLPDDVGGLLFARNEESAKGLLVTNPGHVDPGFKGALTVRAVNLRRVAMVIHIGQPIFTLCLCMLPGPSDRPYSRNIRSREERERAYVEQEQGYHLKRVTDLVTQDSLSALTAEMIRDRVARAVREELARWWRPALIAGVIYIAIILFATAYGVDVARLAKDAFWGLFEEIKGLL